MCLKFWPDFLNKSGAYCVRGNLVPTVNWMSYCTILRVRAHLPTWSHTSFLRAPCVVLFSFDLLAGSSRSLPTKPSMVLTLPLSKPIRQTRHGGRRLVVEDASCIGLAKVQLFKPARQLVQCQPSIDKYLVCAAVFVARTRSVPVFECDYSQGVYFPPTTGGGV